ncbi:MAG: hypothetical protein EOO49_02245 [Flavobacterium sp.]|nr:MAG: hypothetical protein EOO49_02245 [Flavobacterium sp.]
MYLPSFSTFGFWAKQKIGIRKNSSCFIGICNWDFRILIWDLGFGIWNLGFGIWNLGFGIWNLGFGPDSYRDWDLEFISSDETDS